MGLFTHLPQTLGHCVAGEIMRVGSSVQTHQVGDRVRLHPNVSCDVCKYCTTGRDQMCLEHATIGFTGYAEIHAPSPLYDIYHNGGLADYVLGPSWLVDKLPDNVSFEVGAKIHDIANAMQVLRSAAVAPGSTVIITAATGALGAASVKLAPFFGIGRLVLVGRSQKRLDAVKRLAASYIICNTVAIEDLGNDWAQKKALSRCLSEIVPDGADALIDYVPYGTDTWQALDNLGNHGSLVHYGGNPAILPIPSMHLMRRCWKIVGIRNNSRQDAVDVLNLLKNKQLNADELVTHRFGFNEIGKLLDILEHRNEPAWTMVVNL